MGKYFHENRTTRLGHISTQFSVFCQKIILVNTPDRCRDVILRLFECIFAPILLKSSIFVLFMLIKLMRHTERKNRYSPAEMKFLLRF